MKISNILKYNLAAVAVAGLFSLSACSDSKDGKDLWPGIDDGGDEKPTQTALKPRYIWVDAASNFIDFADSKENIARDLTLARDAGFTDIVVDVRTTSGNILYNSSLAPQLTAVDTWVYSDNPVKKRTVYRTATWDYLQAFIDEGHKLGLRIHAGFNTMTGGNSLSGPEHTPTGILFSDPSKKEWATWRYNAGNPRNVMDIGGDTEKFFNPGHPEVVKYLCDLLTDLCKYDIDGIVLDRGRYNDLYSDFSPLSREQFEAYIGGKVPNWPTDILPEGTTNATFPNGAKLTDYTKLWLEYRAKVIYEFMEKARAAVKAVKPDILFGAYVGGWYNSYYNTGVNWASKSYNASLRHTWASTNFKNWGYAELMDQILIGAYAQPTAVNGSNEWSMEGFCSQAKSKIGNVCPLVVGGPDVDWRWTGSSVKYTKDQILSAIRNSVSACANACDGYFLFDMIHLKIDPEKWTAVGAGVRDYVSKWEESQKK